MQSCRGLSSSDRLDNRDDTPRQPGPKRGAQGSSKPRSTQRSGKMHSARVEPAISAPCLRDRSVRCLLLPEFGSSLGFDFADETERITLASGVRRQGGPAPTLRALRPLPSCADGGSPVVERPAPNLAAPTRKGLRSW
jgi:hypothetical protein